MPSSPTFTLLCGNTPTTLQRGDFVRVDQELRVARLLRPVHVPGKEPTAVALVIVIGNESKTCLCLGGFHEEPKKQPSVTDELHRLLELRVEGKPRSGHGSAIVDYPIHGLDADMRDPDATPIPA